MNEAKQDLGCLIQQFERNCEILDRQREWCKNQGFSHKVMTEKEIRAFPIGLENRIKMLSDIKSRPNTVGTANILRVVKEFPQTIAQIFNNLEGQYSMRDILTCCYSLSYFGEVFTNINEQIWSTRTEVWRNESYENYRK
ncbi:hypothetical protein GK047_12700 [Paenibacillus sp. SYP-B3998]|uniref:Uncharacterized protein n=1 Tax=Paenibacillus sp. SYP-B3998 TaxID=2678564 RepID=A0A6G3ZXN1_9BACL|nr:hypothetical protein [Paenibacillus sp. SYP-B3998]NEW06865.1 hypothetical protein [Paenibacillus sp. SYP-B3998]